MSLVLLGDRASRSIATVCIFASPLMLPEDPLQSSCLFRIGQGLDINRDNRITILLCQAFKLGYTA